ncbi:hypothetical protein IE077_001070, partial [Cardiosporidium cionae]
PTCVDGIQNGNEAGIDCGGSCPHLCASCYDGIQNNDEVYIDCGGTFCQTCANCSPALIKPFLLDPTHYDVFTLAPSSSTSSAVTTHYTTAHSRRTRIVCKATNSIYELDCLNGQWLPFRGTAASTVSATFSRITTSKQMQKSIVDFDLLCKAGGVISKGENVYAWDRRELMIFQVPSIILPAEPCTHNILFNFVRELQGECGALLYGGSQSRVGSFCRDGCEAKMRQQVLEDSKCVKTVKGYSVMDIAPILNALLDLYCKTQKTTGGVVGTTYCFTSAQVALNSVLNLQNFAESPSLLSSSCSHSSCFYSNIRYISLLNQLTAFVTVNGLGPFPKPPTPPSAPPSRLLGGTPSALLSFLEKSPIETPSRVDITPWQLFQRHLQADTPRTASASVTSAIEGRSMRFLHAIENLEAIVDLMCIQVAGKFCGASVLKLGKTLPLPETFPILNTSQSEHPCTDSCAVELYRNLGQAMYDASLHRLPLDRYELAVGKLLILYGRTYCQQSYNELYCGDILFRPRFVDIIQQTAFPHYIPATLQHYPHCQCPIEFIGDGQCDSACFNVECGYDGLDCLQMRMFSSIFHNLLFEFPMDDGYRIRRNGCCTASIIEGLNHFLREDSNHPLVKTNQIDLSSLLRTQNALSPTKIVSTLQLDRSVNWMEQTCQVTFDRTCSRGLRRSAMSLQFTIENLDYFKLYGTASSAGQFALTKALSESLRSAVSKITALPLADISEYRTWPGSVNVEFILDAGWLLSLQHFTAEVEDQVKRGVFADTITKLLINSTASPLTNDQSFPPFPSLSPVVKNTRNSSFLVSNTSVKYILRDVQLPHASILSAPPLPNFGTFGMDTLAATLPRPSCQENLDLDIPVNTSLVSSYSTSTHGIVHGTSTAVSCQIGYNALTGISPQILLCDQGRWVPPQGAKLICRRPCSTYTEEDSAVLGREYTLSGVGTTHGSTRTVFCARGFARLAGPSSGSESLVCKNGNWTHRTLECRDSNSVALSNATAHCYTNLNKLNEAYTVKRVTTTHLPLVRSDELLFHVSCSRGFFSNVPKVDTSLTRTSDIPIIEVLCSKNTLLYVGMFHKPPTKTNGVIIPTAASVLPINLRTSASNYKILNFETLSNPFVDSLSCKPGNFTTPAIVTPPLSDAALIIVIFLCMFGALSIALVSFWAYKKYRSMDSAKSVEEDSKRVTQEGPSTIGGTSEMGDTPLPRLSTESGVDVHAAARLSQSTPLSSLFSAEEYIYAKKHAQRALPPPVYAPEEENLSSLTTSQILPRLASSSAYSHEPKTQEEEISDSPTKNYFYTRTAYHHEEALPSNLQDGSVWEDARSGPEGAALSYFSATRTPHPPPDAPSAISAYTPGPDSSVLSSSDTPLDRIHRTTDSPPLYSISYDARSNLSQDLSNVLPGWTPHNGPPLHTHARRTLGLEAIALPKRSRHRPPDAAPLQRKSSRDDLPPLARHASLERESAYLSPDTLFSAEARLSRKLQKSPPKIEAYERRLESSMQSVEKHLPVASMASSYETARHERHSSAAGRKEGRREMPPSPAPSFEKRKSTRRRYTGVDSSTLPCLYEETEDRPWSREGIASIANEEGTQGFLTGMLTAASPPPPIYRRERRSNEANHTNEGHERSSHPSHAYRPSHNGIQRLPLPPSELSEQLRRSSGRDVAAQFRSHKEQSLMKSILSYGEDDELYPDDSASCVANHRAYLYAPTSYTGKCEGDGGAVYGHTRPPSHPSLNRTNSRT